MASQGPLAPSSAVDIASPSPDWTNPTNVLASDGSVASTSVPGSTQSDNLLVTGFGFSIPSDATIDGFVLAINVVTFSGTGFPRLFVGLTKDAFTEIGSQPATSTGTTTLGSSIDLWTDTWTPAQVNDGANFGALIHALAGAGASTQSIDWVTLTVYYTPVASGGVDRPDFSRFPKPVLARAN